MGTDHCVECSRKVTTKQHALQCDSCSLWQHRVCNTGITMKEYRSMMKSEETLNFICTKCNDKEEETTSGPVNSTVITDVSDQPIPDYGTFNLSVISAANSTNNLNRTFTISRDPDQPTEADTTGAVDQPTEADTTGALDQPTEADTTGALDQPTEADTTGAPDTDVNFQYINFK